eukprot:scaffold552988_cov36-Prasinocladus_malaysianus.AAC.1
MKVSTPSLNNATSPSQKPNCRSGKIKVVQHRREMEIHDSAETLPTDTAPSNTAMMDGAVVNM